jgi:hypothetical protein
MPKVTSINTSSIGFGHGNPAKEPARPLRPTTDSPDCVSPDDQRNKGQQLKDGLSSSKTIHHNPGRKP